jgi:hypothetical protein
VVYAPREPERLVKLADDLVALANAETDAKNGGVADVLADLVPSNIGFVRGPLSAAGRGPFRLCGVNTVQLLRDVLPPQPPSMPSPAPGELFKSAVWCHHKVFFCLAWPRWHHS